jgi:hypothetical protein
VSGLDAEYRSPAFSAVVGVALLEAERTGATTEAAATGKKRGKAGKAAFAHQMDKGQFF